MLAIFIALAGQNSDAVAVAPPPPPVIARPQQTPTGVAATPSQPVVVSLEPASTTGITGGKPTWVVDRVIAGSPQTSLPAAVPVVIDIQVSGGGMELMHRALRVMRGSGANFNEIISEASTSPCNLKRYYDNSERRSLNVSLGWDDQGEDVPRASVTVNWQRPLAGSRCASQGSRTVQHMQTVPLAAGETRTLSGDAGLQIILSRR